MPITYSIDNSRGVIYAVWRDRITADILRNYWKELLANPEVLACRKSLADIRAAELDFTGVELADAINSVVLPTLEGKDWKVAILVAAPTQHGVSRQYQVFASQFSTDNIFYDFESALDWLMKSDLSDSDTVPLV